MQNGGAPSIGASYLPPEQTLGEPTKFVAGTPPEQAGQIALKRERATRAVSTSARPPRVLTMRGWSESLSLRVSTHRRPTPADTSARCSRIRRPVSCSPTAATSATSTSPAPGRRRTSFATGSRRPCPTPSADRRRSEAGDQGRDRRGPQLRQLLPAGVRCDRAAVGTFIIYNTFSMIVAQRLRELACWCDRCQRKQVGRSVVFEALVVGAIGSALGLAAGVGLAYGLRSLLNAFDWSARGVAAGRAAHDRRRARARHRRHGRQRLRAPAARRRCLRSRRCARSSRPPATR